MSAGMEVVVDKCVCGEKVLSLPGRFEPLHLPFSSSRRAMRVFRPIIQIAALPVLDVRKQLTPSDAVAPQCVGYDHSRNILQGIRREVLWSRLGVAGSWSAHPALPNCSAVGLVQGRGDADAVHRWLAALSPRPVLRRPTERSRIAACEREPRG